MRRLIKLAMQKALLKNRSFLAIMAGVIMGVAIWNSLSPRNTLSAIKGYATHIFLGFPQLFTLRFPANKSFQSELETLRRTGRLKAEDETLIKKTALSASTELKMPPAILWCLLFQESRLNHLSGLVEGKGVVGLGQFTFSSFYEFNFQLDRYGLANREMLIRVLGHDVRPIGAFRTDLLHPSSYYSIPTAVVATASYLNNRYAQLTKTLERKGIPYDPNIMWMYAAMAYNKGGRTIFNYWNEAYRKSGNRGVEKLVTDRNHFFRSFNDTSTFERVLGSIWTEKEASAFTKELRTHAHQLRECAVSSDERFAFQDISTMRTF